MEVFHLSDNGELLTTSRVIASILGRPHAEVMKKFRRYLAPSDYWERQFLSVSNSKRNMYECGFAAAMRLFEKINAPYEVRSDFEYRYNLAKVKEHPTERVARKPKLSLLQRIFKFFKK